MAVIVRTSVLIIVKTVCQKRAGSLLIRRRQRLRGGFQTTWPHIVLTAIVNSGWPNGGITAGTVGMFFVPVAAI